jgi:TP901 family phage tail tape measure protein
MGSREVRAGRAFVEIVARDNLGAGLQKIFAKLRGVATVVGAIGGAMVAATGTIAGALASTIGLFSSVGDEIEKMATRTGMSAEAVSELGYACDLSGTSVETLENGVRRMQNTIADAARGSETAVKALARFGHSAESLAGMSPDEQLAALADGLSKIEDPAARTAAVMDVFGKSGAELIPLLADGSAGLAAMREQARTLGLSMSDETASSAAALNDALGALWASTRGVALNIGSALAPAVTTAANKITSIIAVVIKWIKENQQIVVLVAKIAAVVGAAGVGIAALGLAGVAAATVFSGLVTIFGGIASVVSGLAGVFGLLFSPIGLAVAAVVALGVALLKGTAVGQKIANVFRIAFGGLASVARDTWRDVVAAFKAGDIGGILKALGTGAKMALGILAVSFALIKDAGSTAWEAIVAAVGRAVTAVQDLWETAKQWVISSWQAIVSAGSSLWSNIVGAISSALAAVPVVLRQIWDMVKSDAKLIGAVLGGLFNDAGRMIASALKAGLSTVTNVLAAIFGPLGSMIAAGASAIGELLGSALGSAADGAGTLIADSLGAVLATLADLWNGAVAVAGSAFSSISAIATRAWSALLTGVAGVAGFIQNSFGAAISFIGQAFAATTQGVWGYLTAILEGVKGLGQGIVSTFMALVSDAQLAWQGISAALAIGDFKLAWQVAWNAIQLIFWKAIKPIQLGWAEFAAGLGTVFDGAIVGIRQAWNNVSTWIAKQIFELIGMLQTAVDKLAEFDPTGLAAQLSASLSIDVDGATKVLEEDRQRFNKQIEDAKRARDENRVKALTTAQQDLDKRIADLAATRDDLNASATDASGGTGIGDKLGPIMDALMKFDLGALGIPGLDLEAIKKRMGEAFGGLDQAVAAPMQGTFSANVAAMMGPESTRAIQERTAKASEQTAENTKKLNRKTDDSETYK